MNVEASVSLANGSRMFFIDNFFTPDLVEGLHSIFQNVNNDWKITTQFKHSPGRLVYTGYQNTVMQQVTSYCKDATSWVSGVIGQDVEFKQVDFWLDTKGYYLPAHYDRGDVDFGLQIYMGTKETINPHLGFTVYRDLQTPLYQMCYRDNSGYLVDDAYTVMHGMEEEIVPPFERWSVYVRYFKR